MKQDAVVEFQAAKNVPVFYIHQQIRFVEGKEYVDNSNVRRRAANVPEDNVEQV
jgi:hypothetical protein